MVSDGVYHEIRVYFAINITHSRVFLLQLEHIILSMDIGVSKTNLE